MKNSYPSTTRYNKGVGLVLVNNALILTTLAQEASFKIKIFEIKFEILISLIKF